MDGLIIYIMKITEIAIQSSSLVSSNKYNFELIHSLLSFREICRVLYKICNVIINDALACR